MKPKSKKHNFGNSGYYLAWAVLVAVLIIKLQSKLFLETIQLANYKPPVAVAELATQASMSEEGRRTFYLNTPKLEAQKEGLNLCTSHDNQETIILGCYVAGKGIFIQQVTDQRLAGTMQVTAAHEMLHAVYHNYLSTAERHNIDQELTRVFEDLDNPRLKKLIQIYRARNPEHVNSELHSFLGTEVAKLSPKLEQHYAKYFVDRSILVTMAQKNEQLFTEIENSADGLERQLQVLKIQMDSRKQTLQELRADQSAGAVALYNSHVQALAEETTYYNRLVNAYNRLSSEGQSLNNSLSNKTP